MMAFQLEWAFEIGLEFGVRFYNGSGLSRSFLSPQNHYRGASDQSAAHGHFHSNGFGFILMNVHNKFLAVVQVWGR